MNLTSKIFAIGLAAAAALTVTSALATAGTANATASSVPTFDFRDCPAIPAGVDHTKWRCEVLVAKGDIKFGNVDIPGFDLTAVTHAEGPLADGKMGQVFGGLRAASSEADLTGWHRFGLLRIRPEYAGHSDFLSPGGAIDMKFKLIASPIAKHCSIGSNTDPIKFAPARVPGSDKWISKNPPIRMFEATDTTYAVPKAYGCGPFSRPVDRILGIPSPTGANTMTVTAYYSYRPYSTLTGTQASPPRH